MTNRLFLVHEVLSKQIEKLHLANSESKEESQFKRKKKDDTAMSYLLGTSSDGESNH